MGGLGLYASRKAERRSWVGKDVPEMGLRFSARWKRAVLGISRALKGTWFLARA